MNIDLDTSALPAGNSLRAPGSVPHALNATTCSTPDLLPNPAAIALAQQQLPAFEMQITGEALKPQLDNFSMRFLVQFGCSSPRTSTASTYSFASSPRRKARNEGTTNTFAVASAGYDESLEGDDDARRWGCYLPPDGAGNCCRNQCGSAAGPPAQSILRSRLAAR